MRQYPGKTHWIAGQPGWEEVADYALGVGDRPPRRPEGRGLSHVADLARLPRPPAPRRRPQPRPARASTSSPTSRCCRPGRRRARRWRSGRSRSRAPSTRPRRGPGRSCSRLPQETFTVDIHCVTKWSKLGTTWTGVSVDTLLEGVSTRGRVPHRLQRRRLHDEPRRRGRHRRQGVGRPHVRRRAARARARRPGPPARAAPVLLEEREVGARASCSRRRTSRASGRRPATTIAATHGKSSATGATEGAARLAPGHRRRHRRRDRLRAHARARRPRLARPRRRPARRRAPDRRGRLPGAALLLDRLGARGPGAEADGRAHRRRRGLPLPHRRAARGRRARAARAGRRPLHLARRTTAGRCCWSAAAPASCR